MDHAEKALSKVTIPEITLPYCLRRSFPCSTQVAPKIRTYDLLISSRVLTWSDSCYRDLRVGRSSRASSHRHADTVPGYDLAHWHQQLPQLVIHVTGIQQPCLESSKAALDTEVPTGTAEFVHSIRQVRQTVSEAGWHFLTLSPTTAKLQRTPPLAFAFDIVRSIRTHFVY